MMRVHFATTSNADLLAETKSLVRSSEDLEIKIIYRLDEIRGRGLDSAMGYGSTTRFAIEVLGMTPDQAAKRLAATTNCRDWPELMILLEHGAISLSTINMVGPKLTEANKDLLLGELAGKSTREIRLLLASIDAHGRRIEQGRMVDLRLSLSEQALSRWERARSLVAKVKMMTFEDALTAIVDDFLRRHDPLAKAERAQARSMRKFEEDSINTYESNPSGRAPDQSRDIDDRVTDCLAAGRPDGFDGDATDCLAAGRPDGFDGDATDCRAAGRPDGLDGAATDCRAAGRPDGFDGDATDCRAAGRPDGLDGDATDCRAAGRPDGLDGAATDCRAAKQSAGSARIAARWPVGREESPEYEFQSDTLTREHTPDEFVQALQQSPPGRDAHEDPNRTDRSHRTSGIAGRSRSRFVSAHVRHALWIRAGGRCEAPDCRATEGLQIDHRKVMFCQGGTQSLDNLQLLCAPCHKLKTAFELGREQLERRVRERIDAMDGIFYARGHFIPPVNACRRQV